MTTKPPLPTLSAVHPPSSSTRVPVVPYTTNPRLCKLQATTAATAVTLCFECLKLLPEEAKKDLCFYTLATSCVYLAGKCEEDRIRVRNLLNTAHELLHPTEGVAEKEMPEREYWHMRDGIGRLEYLVLRTLAFDVSPYLSKLTRTIVKHAGVLQSANPSAFSKSPNFLRTALRICMHVHEIPSLMDKLNDDQIFSVAILRIAMHIEGVDETILTTSKEYVEAVREKRRKKSRRSDSRRRTGMRSDRPIDIDDSPSPTPPTHWTEELCDDCSPSRVMAVEAILHKLVYEGANETMSLEELVKRRLESDPLSELEEETADEPVTIEETSPPVRQPSPDIAEVIDVIPLSPEAKRPRFEEKLSRTARKIPKTIKNQYSPLAPLAPKAMPRAKPLSPASFLKSMKKPPPPSPPPSPSTFLKMTTTAAPPRGAKQSANEEKPPIQSRLGDRRKTSEAPKKITSEEKRRHSDMGSNDNEKRQSKLIKSNRSNGIS